MTAAERHAEDHGAAPAPPWMHGLLHQIVGVNAHIQAARAQPLGGGVSSDIYRVDVAGRTLCVKRALAKLKVAADWHVPVDRNAHEAAWLRSIAAIAPSAVPRVLAEDRREQAFAMEWLAPDRYPVWKAQLGDGSADPATAGQVGDVLGRIHAATAGLSDVSARFATDTLFHAIRLEPYLLATARSHPDLAARLERLAERTATTRYALVHGDFSPKNLLVGAAGPVIVDAECAWYGDPAFDLAFVLNHLLLKGAWRPRERDGFLAMYARLVEAYRPHVTWEPWSAIEQRTATLLPGLLLARVDGKSPVEYLDAGTAASVRTFARRQLTDGVDRLAELAARWEAAA
jgi:aminoglycoside phosphotransferase (APT) family kinase protein